MSFARLLIALSLTSTMSLPVAAAKMPWEADTPQGQTQPFSPGIGQEEGTGDPNVPWVFQENAATADLIPDLGAGASDEVDESALRYYAARGEVARVSAEIRRLKSIHADWEPPEDIFEVNRVEVNEQPLWDLFSKQEYDALYAKIREYMKTYPGYQPSPELTKQIVTTDVRRKLIAASDAGNSTDVLKIVAERPDLLVCREMDILWRVADALVKSDRREKAFDAYRYILINCDNEAERLATLQKATTHFNQQAVAQLIQLGRTSFDGTMEFSGIEVDFVRAKVGKAISEEPGAATAADVAYLEAEAEKPEHAEDAKLLGWYYFSRQNFPAAKKWFQTALREKLDNKALEGLILSLREAGEYEEAEKLAYAHRHKDPLLLKAYLEVMIVQIAAEDRPKPSANRVLKFAEAIDEAKSPDAAQILGWYLFDRGQLDDARFWFERSVEYTPTEEGLIGLVVVAQRDKNVNRLNTIIDRWSDNYPALEEYKIVVAKAAPRRSTGSRNSGPADPGYDRAIRNFRAGDYDAALAILEDRAVSGREKRGAKLLRGWALYHKGRWREARNVFREADGIGSTRDSREGVRLAHERLARPSWRTP